MAWRIKKAKIMDLGQDYEHTDQEQANNELATTNGDKDYLKTRLGEHS